VEELDIKNGSLKFKIVENDPMQKTLRHIHPNPFLA